MFLLLPTVTKRLSNLLLIAELSYLEYGSIEVIYFLLLLL